MFGITDHLTKAMEIFFLSGKCLMAWNCAYPEGAGPLAFLACLAVSNIGYLDSNILNPGLAYLFQF